MIFLTVGSEFPFDRLVKAVDNLATTTELSDQVFAQVGIGGYKPTHMFWVPTMERHDYLQRLRASDAVIAHAGMGTIMGCLDMQKPLLVMPRLSKLREVVNDHQIDTALAFEVRGQILVAHDVAELKQRLNELREFHPLARPQEAEAIIHYIRDFLEKLVA
jgi:UDP-N-acetylglucosamine transferase subunit ALG13